MPAYESLVVESHMPNVENLRKQAKQILRWHRERHFPVAATIRTYMPSLSDLSDLQILDCPFKLVDAQAVVARRKGFDSWLALTSGVEQMTNQPSNKTTRPTLIQVEPQLFVNDLEASCQYYQSAMGFSIAFEYGEPPFYAQVVRDGVKLNLRLVHEPVYISDLREKEGLLSASITVENIKALFLEFQEEGAVFAETLCKQPWGARTFTVKDPDGNLIMFAE